MREDTKTTQGINAAQRLWLGDLADNGGRAFVFAKIGQEWLLVPAYAGLDKTTKEEWSLRSLIHITGSMDWDRLMDILTH